MSGRIHALAGEIKNTNIQALKQAAVESDPQKAAKAKANLNVGNAIHQLYVSEVEGPYWNNMLGRNEASNIYSGMLDVKG